MLINSAEITMLPNLAALRALSTSDLKTVFVSGTIYQGDGGGGFYYKDPTDTTSQDNNLSVIVTTSGDRWKSALALLPYKQIEFQTPAVIGNFSITGVGFKPRSIEIRSTLVSTSVAYQCYGTYSPGIQRAQYICTDVAGRAGGNVSDQIINLRDTAGLTSCVANVSQTDTNGFTLNFTGISLRPWCLATCYW